LEPDGRRRVASPPDGGRAFRAAAHRRARPAGPRLDDHLGQVVVVDGDAALLLQVIDEGVHRLRAQIPEQALLDLALDLGQRAVEAGPLLREADDRPPLVGLDRRGQVTDVLELEGRLDDRLGDRRRILAEERQVAAAGLRLFVVGVLGHQIPKALLIAEPRRPLGERLRLGVGVVGLSLVLGEDGAHAHLVLLVKLGRVLVVVLLDVGVGDVLDLQLGLEVLLHQLGDHLLLHDPLHVGILVVAAPGRLRGHHLELDQAVDELPLLVGGRVTRANERRLLVDPLLHVLDGDDRVVDLGDDLRRVGVAGLAGGVCAVFAGRSREGERAEREREGRRAEGRRGHPREITRPGR
jgi:hypothetical protein